MDNDRRSTAGTIHHAQIADGLADTWLGDIAADLAKFRAALDADGLDSVRVVAVLDHEVEVKDKQGLLTLDTVAYAQATVRFYGTIDAATPGVESAHWYGYARRDVIDKVGAALVAAGPAPDLFILDPYVWAHTDPTTTLEGMAAAQLEWLRSRPWYAGQGIVLGEYAKDSRHGDESVAEFVTDLRPRLAALGVAAAVWFHRDRTGGDIRGVMDPVESPLTVEAYAANFR